MTHKGPFQNVLFCDSVIPSMSIYAFFPVYTAKLALYYLWIH